MAYTSSAQTLPLHIIEGIASYIPKTRSARLPVVNGEDSSVKQKTLLPLMAVCKQWRFVIGSLFYKSALLNYDSKKLWVHKHESLIKLEDVIATNSQHHLKKIQVYISPEDFKTTNNSTSLLREFLDKAGPLERVREVTLFFAPHGSIYRFQRNNEPEDVINMDLFSATLDEYAKLFHQLLPNQKIVNVYKTQQYRSSAKFADIVKRMSEFMPQLLSSQVCHFFSMGIDLTKPFVDNLKGASLRRISIAKHKGTQQHIELIRRNAQTLEVLHIKNATTHAFVKMTYRGAKQGTLVYPRLRELYITSCSGYRSMKHNQPTCDPFPVLRVLDCQGNFPFATPIVLDHGRNHLDVLRIDADRNLLEILGNSNVLEDGSFKYLNVISLGWRHRVASPSDNHANQIFVKAINMAPFASTVENCGLHVSDFEQSVLPKINFSDHLRTLNLEGTVLTMKDTVKLLSKFKRLDDASISLKEEPTDNNIRMPTVESLQEYQRELKSYSSSNVGVLNIRHAHYKNSRRAAEFLVLMTSIMTSIRKIVVGRKNISRPDSIVRRVSFVLRRPIYKTDDHVNSVEYKAEDYTFF
ncbi:hypothetical protein FB645_000464 [Coemansia sp. IMI 203386]|nr:hypothetical protein FB645_000464 [Coemansia sp. IMI 203386]